MITTIKIAHLTSVHGPDDVRILYKECRTLSTHGFNVTLVVPHYRHIDIKGVTVRTIPKPKSRFQRFIRTTWQVYWTARKEKAKLYHFHDPELLFVGILLRCGGAKVIFDVHENIEKQILSKHWIIVSHRRLISLLVRQIERIATSCINGIIAATPSIASKFPEHKTTLIQNYPILGELMSLPHIPYYQRGLRISYIGGITLIRGAREMIQAVELLPSTMNIELLLAGNIVPSSLEEELRKLPGWKRVIYVGWVSRGQLPEYLMNTRVGLLLFHPVPNHFDAQPNKMFEYMAAGIPVIASDFPHWRSIIGATNCGLLVNPLDPEDIAEAIRWIFEHPVEAEQMGKRGADAVRCKYNWENETKALLDLYDRLI